ncbi:MAG: GMC family oxidoreductase [Alphaproteobacteria bacterium]|nr:GMC family oxidoreductase [Alphaproteobacteria bacterium]
MDDEVAAVTFEEDDDGVVVVIGSGASGGTLANELCHKGIKVVVLEAGPRLKLTDFENDEYTMYHKLSWLDERTVTGRGSIARNWPRSPTWVCKTVGGSTVHWAGLSLRWHAHEFQARTRYGAVAGASLMDWPLSLSDLEPFYAKAEDKMGVTGTNGIPHLPPTNNYKILSLGARRVGYELVDTSYMAINAQPRDGRNACDQIGFCMQGCKSGAKWSTLYTEIPKAEATGNLELRADCMALRVEHDPKGKVTGVLYADRSGQQHLQKARVVVVACNAIESPRLLLNSASNVYPEGLGNSSGMVGKNYTRHMTGYVYGVFDKPVNMYRGTTASGLVRDEWPHEDKRGFCGGYVFGTCALGLPYFAAFLNPGAWGREFTSDIEAYDHLAGTFINGEDMPIETNQVSLHPNKRDRFGLPIPNINIDDHPNDTAMRNYSLKQVAELMMAAGAVRTIECPPMPGSHNMGTCRMSNGARDGVVNKWGQTHDIPNLFVADGSIFTTAGGCNPTLTIVTLAMREAAYIAEQMRTNAI